MQPLKKPIVFETTYATYTATEIIGEGGAGRVYGATNEDGLRAAVKVLNWQSATTDKRKRFKNEIEFLRRANNPHVVPLLDRGLQATGTRREPFYVMPRHEGNLRDLMKAGIDRGDVIDFFGQILRGVEAAHLMGARHRDLKPENVLFRRESNVVILAVADFGVASFNPDLQATAVETSAGTRLANFVYAAPEQRQPGQLAGVPADIFALGLILNELFTGAVPHGTQFKRIAGVDPSKAHLDDLVGAMTHQDPAARLSSIEEVKRKLRLDHDLAMIKQRLGETGAVVIDTEVDDPLVTDPIRIVEADWNDGHLKLTLNRAINAGWESCFRGIGTFTSAIRPASFSFKRNFAAVQVGGESAQRVIDHFKEWLPRATEAYRQGIVGARKREAELLQEELRKQRTRDEERQRVISGLKV